MNSGTVEQQTHPNLRYKMYLNECRQFGADQPNQPIQPKEIRNKSVSNENIFDTHIFTHLQLSKNLWRN